MKFAQAFKHLRVVRRLTQQQLATDLGISKSTVSMYENGYREPDLETLERIANYFNVDINLLSGWDFKEINNTLNSNPTPINKSLPQKYQSMVEEYERLRLSKDPKDQRDKFIIDCLLGLNRQEDYE